MSDVFRTMIIPASLATLARALAAGLSPQGVNMFQVKLSPDGTTPTTHYVSTGLIDQDTAALLGDADALYAACVEAGATVTLTQCQSLVNNSDVTDENPFAVFERMGLKMISKTIP